MGMYHLHVGNIGGRNSGKSDSAVGFSAYISGERIEAERTGITYDFSKKEVTEKMILLPENAPERFLDRATLWNEVERIEGVKNARFAKTIDAALPKDLSVDECKSVMRDFGNFFTEKGMIADMALHYSVSNPHIHVLLTTRKIDDSGDWETYKKKSVYALDEDGNRIPMIDKETGLQKTDSRNRLQWKRVCVIDTGWNRKEFLQDIRKEWEEVCNDALERSGIEDRIDCRSYADQGIDKIPTLHEGRAAREMEAKGQIADICEENRKIRKINMLHDLIEKVSGGIEVLHHKIESVTMEVQQEFFDAFKSITARAADLIEANRMQKVDQDKKNEDPVDSSGIYKKDEDPVDRDEDWWDPV